MKKYVILSCLVIFFLLFLMAHPSRLSQSVSENDVEYPVSPEGSVSAQTHGKCSEKITVNEVRLDVVYIAQNDKNSCATTSVAMVISYYERLKDDPLNKDTVWNISGSDESMIKRYGNDMDGLKRIADHYGYKSKYLEYMELSDVEQFLSKGTPVTLNILFNKQASATHAILVIGYNKNRRIFYINDPSNEQNKILEYSDLESRWSAHLTSPRGMSYRSGFIVYPKNYNNGA
jgi:uncharacterized protein YvpB